MLKLTDALPGLEGLDGVMSLNVGVLGGATNAKTGESVAEYAMDNEYGAPARNIPPRRAIRATFDANIDGWSAGLAELLVDGMRGEGPTDAATALDITGQVMVGDIKRAISEWETPANSEQTIERKGFNAPLRDTGAYLGAIAHRVDGAEL